MLLVSAAKTQRAVRQLAKYWPLTLRSDGSVASHTGVAAACSGVALPPNPSALLSAELASPDDRSSP